MQTSLDVMSHSKMNEIQECGKDPLSQVVNEAPLTNGHAHLVNGALKLEDLSPFTHRSSVDKELPESRVKISEDKPQNPHTKHDPYEFPHSPPKQSDQSPVSPEHSSSQGASGQRPPPPTYQEAIKATENHLKQLQPSCQVNSDPEKTPLSPASRPLSHAPIRLNGSHHNAFSFDTSSLNTSDVTTKPDPPTEKSSPSKSSAQLLAQTGGLISEFYSHSRLHQISTWRSGFSEYVNELHSKRKAAGANSFCGKERLRKSVAQHSAYRQGRKGKVALLLLPLTPRLHVNLFCESRMYLAVMVV